MTSSASPAARGIVLAVFFLSGFAALLYQVVWQRILVFFSGSEAYAITLIVSAYMAGLGCGSLAGGHLADRIGPRRALFLFAAAELAIVLFALQSRWFFYDFLYLEHAALSESGGLLGLLLFASLLWPTFCMGASLPLLVRALAGGIDTAARTVGALYGWNTLGAAVGAAVATWLLLRRFDFETCIRVGAALNAVCAAAALSIAVLRKGLSLPESAPTAGGDASPVGSEAERPAVAAYLVLYGLSGFNALCLELIWFRIIGVALKDSAFMFGSVLSIFLLGSAAGTLVGVRRVERAVAPRLAFLWMQAGIGLYAGASLVVLVVWLGSGAAPDLGLVDIDRALDGWRAVFTGGSADPKTSAHAWRFAVNVIGLPLLLVAPPTFLMGLSFPYLQRAVQTEMAFLGRRVAWLQTSNIAGSVLGSVLTGWVLLPLVGTPGAARTVVVASGVFLLLALREGRDRDDSRPSWLGIAAPVAAVLCTALLVPPTERLWARLQEAPTPTVLVREGTSGVASVQCAGPRCSLMLSGWPNSSIPYGGIQSLFGVVPLVHHEQPEKVLLVGLGSGDTLHALGSRPSVTEMVVFEISHDLRPLLEEWSAQAPYVGLDRILHDPRIRYVETDARIELTRSRERFDVIVTGSMLPRQAHMGNLSSVEYFELVRRHLEPGGLAGVWAPSQRTVRTFASVFPEYRCLALGRWGFYCLGGSRSIGPVDLPRRARVQLARYFAEADIDVGRLLSDLRWQRFDWPEPLREGDVNRDLFARDEFVRYPEGESPAPWANRR